MIPSAFSILFISCIILVHGIHPLKQFQEHIELKPLSYFNETSFVEAQGLITASLTVFLKKIDDKAATAAADKAAKEAARSAIQDDAKTRHTAVAAKITALKAATYTPLYVTKEGGALPSIYCQVNDHTWCRLRLQHDRGPTVDGPHFAESYCDTTGPEGIKLLAGTLIDHFGLGKSATRLQIDSLVAEINKVTKTTKIERGYDCVGGHHIEIFFTENPTDKSVAAQVRPHVSGGVLYKIDTAGTAHSYNKGVALDIPKSLELIEEVLFDLEVISRDKSTLKEDVIVAAGTAILPYYSRDNAATFPYVPKFNADGTSKSF